MNYEILNGDKINLDELPQKQKKLFEEVYTYYQKKPGWNEFSNYWKDKIRSAFENQDPREVIRAPVFRVFQDMEARIGIYQGFTRKTDYRDTLTKIIAEKYKSRYKFCKDVGISETFLSKILAKKRHLSIEKLEEILSKIGYEIEVKEKRHEEQALV